MAAELYPYNEEAYRKAVHMMQEHGSAAVVHPTGIGKSFIVFKLAGEHPGEGIVWLASNECIFRPEKEN